MARHVHTHEKSGNLQEIILDLGDSHRKMIAHKVINLKGICNLTIEA